MLPGEKELAEKLRTLVSKNTETKDEQAAVLNELGKLYLQAAIDQKDGEYFTKASALFNCALVRTSDENIKLELKEELKEVRDKLLHMLMEEPGTNTFKEWENRNQENKNILKNLRQNVRHACHKLEILMERYDYESDERQEMERILGVETKALSLLVKQEMSGFITMLWQQCLQDTKKEPPCKYSLLGLGSLARQEVTPYSDLEFAILIEKDSDQIQEYFKHLTYLFHLSVLDLGETPIAGMAIFSLNDFRTPGGDWFYDSITPSGFKLDGSMPWACKTPVGRPATDTKEALSLIQTPVEMAQLQRSDNVLGQSYHVADVMSQTVHLVGDSQFHEIYKQEVVRLIESDLDMFRKRGIKLWKEDSKKYLDNSGVNTFGYLNAKFGLYRFISTAVENLRLCLAPSFLTDSSWRILDHLVEIGKISKEGALNLTTALSIAFTYRLLTYFANLGQYETIGLFQSSKDKKDVRSELFDCKNQLKQPLWKKRDLFNQHQAVITALMANKFEEDDSTCLVELLHETFSRSIYSDDPLFMMSNKSNLFLNLNIRWAIKGEDIPKFPCGTSCLRYLALNLEIGPQDIDIRLQKIDVLLQSIHYCMCMSVLQIHLNIYKIVLIREFKLPYPKPNLSASGLVQILEEDVKVRDRFFLLLGLFGMVSSETDETTLRKIIAHAESFLKSSEELQATDRLYVNDMMVSYVYGLLYLYRLVNRTDDIIRVCQKWIQKIEKPTASEGLSPHLIRFHDELAKAYWKIPGNQEQAFKLWKKNIEILLSVCRVEPMAVSALCDCVFTLVEKFKEENLYKKATDILSRFFIDDRELYNFSDGQIVEAFGSLADCYKAVQDFGKSLELLEKIVQTVSRVENLHELSDRKRDTMASNLIIAYMRLFKFDELPKAAEFHSMLCQSIPDKVVRVFERKQFLLKHCLKLVILRRFRESFYRQGMAFYEKACDLNEKVCNYDEPTKSIATNNGVYSVIDVYISYCKLSDIYKHTKNHFSANMLFVKIEKHLDENVVSEQESLTKLCRLYLDYRRCACFVYVAVNHQQRHLLDTVHFLQLTRFSIRLYYPQSRAAYSWIGMAVILCKDTMKKFHLTSQDFKETFIGRLIKRRCGLSEKKKQIFNAVRNELMAIIKHI